MGGASTGRPFEEPLAASATARSGPERQGGEQRLWLWIGGPLLFGCVLGLALPDTSGSAAEAEPWRRLSQVLGWAYFCAWSVSFYPQVVQNFQRRSVVGLSVDYQLLNLGGFSSYFAFNAALYWNTHVKDEYVREHGKPNAVELNDVFFAGHAVLLTAVTLYQIVIYYDYPLLERPERLLRYVVVTAMLAVAVGATGLAVFVRATSEGPLTWLAYFTALSEVKVAISIVKYCPQVWMNWRRKSTDGWSIINVLLDFAGGLLSILQLLIDALAIQDWSAVTGDPAKFLLGNLSMFFDVIFMLQHYCLYGSRLPAHANGLL